MGKPDKTAPKAKGGHGGARPGNGRPRAEITKLRDDWETKFIDMGSKRFAEYFDAISCLALGVHAEKEIDGEKVIVYQMPPDLKALTYIFDRMAGKPKQAVTVDAGTINIREAVSLTNQAAVEYQDPDDEESDAQGV